MEIHRAELVHYALAHGLKPAAREFQTTVKTVRKWVDRFKSHKRPGLRNQLNRPYHSPTAMDQASLVKLERIYCERRDRNYRINAALVCREVGIPYSLPIVLKAFRSFGMKRRPTKHDTKRDLWKIKAKYRAMEKIQIDAKYLDDIPELHVAYERYLLPRFQYAARCVRTGTLFIDRPVDFAANHQGDREGIRDWIPRIHSMAYSAGYRMELPAPD
jgi:transposase